MIETYLASTRLELLEKIEPQENKIFPVKGRAAITGRTDEGGSPLPDIPALGDPNTWYAAIRTNEEFIPPEGVDVIEPTPDVLELIGGWA